MRYDGFTKTKKEYSLFIGRFQPFHDGHKAIMDKVLEEGKNIVIALRDTERTESNPYSIGQRKAMIKKAYRYEIKKDRVKIIKIPDITEVCYGRKVGWGIREIAVGKETEEISATKIRDEKNKQ